MDEVIALNAVETICSHNALCVLDFAYTYPHFYIVTEYLGEFVTLDHLQHLSDLRLMKIARHLMEGLNEIHRMGVVHRDIKPENLMVHQTTEEIKYIDFGLFCYQKQCEIRRVAGSPAYMAPEIVFVDTSDHVFPRNMDRWFLADIWSLGIVLLEMCCDRLQPERPVLLESIGSHFGYQILDNEGDLIQLEERLYKDGITDEILSWLYQDYPVSDPMKSFIKRSIQPMVQGKPMYRKMIVPEISAVYPVPRSGSRSGSRSVPSPLT